MRMWNERRVGRGALCAVGAAALCGAVVFACGSDEPPACEGPGCVTPNAEASVPSDGATDSMTTPDAPGDGGLDANDASDTSTNCTGPAGTLDPTFGDGGIVVLSYGSETATAGAVAIQPDGKLIIAGTKTNNGQAFAIVRLLSNGIQDPTFGAAGLVERKVGNTSHVLSAVALQPDGKLLIAGHTRFVGQNFDFAVLRFSADGTPDTTFGTSGVVLTDFGTRSDQAKAMALMTDGRIVVSGQTISDDLTVADMAFARYTADGALDTTFGSGGRVTVDVRGTPDEARALVVLPSGRILAAGTSRDPALNRLDITAIRLNSDGTLDTTFGKAGHFVSSFGGIGNDIANAVALDPAGKAMLGGVVGGTNMGTIRLTASGALDPTFGAAGLATTDFDNRNDEGNVLFVQPDGSILVAGTASNGIPTDGRIAVARHLPDGALDGTFGSGGKTLTALPSGYFGANAQGGALGACSLTIVGGWGQTATSVSTMGIVRYRR